MAFVVFENNCLFDGFVIFVNLSCTVYGFNPEI